MSEVRTRPRVQGVSSAVLSAAAAGAVVAASQVLASAVSSLVSLRRDVPREIPPLIQPVTAVRGQAVEVPDVANLPPIEAAKASALLRVVARPYLVQNPAALEAPLAALNQARTLGQVRQAEALLTAALESQHQAAFVSALKQACENACREIGFNAIEATSVPGRVVRVIATDPAGRTLVTEIEGNAEMEPRMATEVVGVSDDSCHGILDRFDRALEAQGVRGSAVRRKFTGGVCQLAAAREFVRRKVRKSSLPPAQRAQLEEKQALRRVQGLNKAHPARVQRRD